MRTAEARVREWEMKASQRAWEDGKRRVAKRCKWVIWAEMEWSERVFFVVVSVSIPKKGRKHCMSTCSGLDRRWTTYVDEKLLTFSDVLASSRIRCSGDNRRVWHLASKVLLRDFFVALRCRRSRPGWIRTSKLSDHMTHVLQCSPSFQGWIDNDIPSWIPFSAQDPWALVRTFQVTIGPAIRSQYLLSTYHTKYQQLAYLLHDVNVNNNQDCFPKLFLAGVKEIPQHRKPLKEIFFLRK